MGFDTMLFAQPINNNDDDDDNGDSKAMGSFVSNHV